MYVCMCVQMLSGQLLTTAWLPPAWSMRQTWWCPSTTWTTSSTQMRMIWRLVGTLAHMAMNITLHRVWSDTVWLCVCVCFCTGIYVPEQCLHSAHHQQTAFTTFMLRWCYVWYWLAGTTGVRNTTGMNLLTDNFDLSKWSGAKILLCFGLQPGSRRPVNGTDDKFGNKEPKPSTLDPVSCISMYLFWCLPLFFLNTP